LPLFRDGIADDLYDCGYANAGIAYSFFMYKFCMNHRLIFSEKSDSFSLLLN
jgi:hypothetical protein